MESADEQTGTCEGVIKSHNRISGWVGLVKYFAKALEGEVKKRDFTIVRRDGTR